MNCRTLLKQTGMKSLKCILLLAYFFSVSVLVLSCGNKTTDLIFIENGKIELGFDKETGTFLVFRDLINNHEFIDRNLVRSLPWEITYQQFSDLIKIDQTSFSEFSYLNPDPFTLVLKWENFTGINNDDFSVTAEITLDNRKAFSYWDIFIEGTNGKLITEVVFPKIEGIKDLGEEELVVPTWMGSLINDPRSILSDRSGNRWGWSYPGSLSSQLLALYNSDKIGFYASCNDSLSYTKNFAFELDAQDNLIYEMINYPVYDSTLNSYTPSYEAVIGSFKGDWITVAEIYREWATKQRWARESRFKQGLTPTWLENTALWVWNRGHSDNVLTPAVALKERLGLPVSVFWHWWHHCSYDDNFPEYMPPREGAESFINAVTAAQEAGVKCHVYMNALQWGDASEGWKSSKVEPYTVKDINGNIRSHVYNIFSGNALINMCVGTDFWRDYYAALCDSAVNIYQTNGVYMDQTCLSRMCYDSDHGHDLGGGNYWVENSGKLISQVRANDYGDKEPIFTGEGSSENWLPHLDAFLTLQASRERYAGVTLVETIPFFQAVYHQYGITYGSYSSLVTPPYDVLWPDEYAPDQPEQPLDEIFNQQFLMEQARSFVWGLQPCISNYHDFLATEREEEINYLLNIARLRYEALEYLLYGKFLRPPYIEAPEKEIDISRLSIYAGRRADAVTVFTGIVPLLYTGAWKADNNNTGIVLASISDDELPIDFSINSEDYDLPPSGNIYIKNNEGRKHLSLYTDGEISVNFSLPAKGLCIVEIVPAYSTSQGYQ
jgi:hypothetical protein